MKQKIWLVVLLFPVLVQAQSMSHEFNSLLENIFSPDTAKPTLYVPQNPTEADLERIKQTILQEYGALREFDADIVQTQSRLYELANQKQNLQKELSLLDVDLNLAKKKLAEYSALERKWKKTSDQLEYNVSVLRHQLRAEKKRFNAFLNKKFIQNESRGHGSGISLLDWLFSQKTVSQILEEKKQVRNYQAQKLAFLKKQDTLQRELTLREGEAKRFFEKYARLKTDITDQEKILAQLAQSKAKKLAVVKKDLTKVQDALSQKNFAQQRATEYLISLQDNARKIERKLLEKKQPSLAEALLTPIAKTSVIEMPKVVETEWVFPLKIPRKVTAGFKDKNYQKKLGRVHLGVDLLAPQGTPVYAPKDAVVQKVSQSGLDYAYVILGHKGNTYTLFGHLWKILVREGDVVKKGQRIALSGGAPGMEGSGPFTTGAHLHWEMFKNGQHVDPLTVVK